MDRKKGTPKSSKKSVPKTTPNKSKKVKPDEPQVQTEHQVLARKKRYVAHRSVLTELRRIERHMQPAIPRLPFQRVVRQIAIENHIKFRWMPSALLCLQEAAEDWLVEFFEDAYFLSAHAHRMTILPKDFNTLRIIRYRHERLLQPILAGDRRMADILTLPPLHPRQVATSAKHDRNTRSQGQREERDDAPIITEVPVDTAMPDAAQEPIANPAAATTSTTASASRRRIQRRRTHVREQEAVNRIALSDLDGTVSCRVAFNVAGNREVEELRIEDINVFRDQNNMMTDMAMKVVLW